MTSVPIIASNTAPAPVSTSNAWVPLAQWLAILAMTIEHGTKFVWPDSPLTSWAIAFGRIAFPLFAGMVAWHLVHNTRWPFRYVCRLLLVGVVAQLPYALVVTPYKLNVCFTLALGLLSVHAIYCLEDGWDKGIGIICLSLAAIVLTPYVEYGVLGCLLVAAFALVFQHPYRTIAAIPALLLAALINGSPLTMAISTATTVALVLLANGVWRFEVTVPALPRWLRLSWYPLHLAVIALVMLVGAL